MSRLKEHWWLKLRRLFADGELSARILKLSKSHGTSAEPGLIMIQIDGLSKSELEKAFQNNEVSFLKKLMSKEKYHLHSLYTGLPSTTPAIQGELFYGVKQIVPAFYYFDKILNRPIKMLEWKSVEDIEKRLKEEGEGLLTDGSSYSNIFSGGAKEAHFCAASLGLSKIWKNVHIIRFILLSIVHTITFIRIIILTVYEIILSLIGFLKGIWDKKNLWIEFKFIFLRVSICILLRELITLGVRIDIARGLPIIHLNFLGYDEHAHHRGPSSKDAHNALQGIDQAIETIYQVSLHSTRRQYDVWIYSDHGQDNVESYRSNEGKTVGRVVKKIYSDFLLTKNLSNTNEQPATEHVEDLGVQFTRAGYLGHWFHNLSLLKKEEMFVTKDAEIFISAIGPTAQIYITRKLSLEDKRNLALAFIQKGSIPLVMIPEDVGKVRAWNKKGEFVLPEQSPQVIGSSHPYLNEVTKDLIELCHHPHAGEFTLCGWSPDEKPISFPLEYGAHAGPGIGETDAFLLTPKDIPFNQKNDSFITTSELRRSALKFLKRKNVSEVIHPAEKAPDILKPKSAIRLMTYNVHSCVGMDGKLSVERIARVIARYEPDIVALQELDCGRIKTSSLDQPHLIAKHLEMLYHFHPSIDIEEEKYGNAILSRYPIQMMAAKSLPALMSNDYFEPRGALWVKIKINNISINIINTHLGLLQKEAVKQAEVLMGNHWLKHAECRGPVILCGDFNTTPNSECWNLIHQNLQDVSLKINQKQRPFTWFSHLPLRAIDHIFVSSEVEVVQVEAPKSDLNRQASDHLPLIADLRIT